MYRDEKDVMKDGLYSIGSMSELTGLSVTAIRYYCEKGLIEPSYIDESTGYRYFSSRHVWKLEKIRMYKQLGFSLSDILELQETSELETLEHIIWKNQESVRKQMEQLNETRMNLEWLKDQCSIFRIAQTDEGFITRYIPERKVLYMKADNDKDIWELVMLHQKKIAKELKSQKTIQRCYGYVMDNAFLDEMELKLKGEYISFEKYHTCNEDELMTLPAGNYLCVRNSYREWNDLEELKRIKRKVESLGVKSNLMILEESSLYLLSLEDAIYELQIYLG